MGEKNHPHPNLEHRKTQSSTRNSYDIVVDNGDDEFVVLGVVGAGAGGSGSVGGSDSGWAGLRYD